MTGTGVGTAMTEVHRRATETGRGATGEEVRINTTPWSRTDLQESVNVRSCCSFFGVVWLKFLCDICAARISDLRNEHNLASFICAGKKVKRPKLKQGCRQTKLFEQKKKVQSTRRVA